jgi:hypothetical protein
MMLAAAELSIGTTQRCAPGLRSSSQFPPSVMREETSGCTMAGLEVIPAQTGMNREAKI